jgi:hypothetical protein
MRVPYRFKESPQPPERGLNLKDFVFKVPFRGFRGFFKQFKNTLRRFSL